MDRSKFGRSMRRGSARKMVIGTAARAICEGLESRTLLSVTIPVRDVAEHDLENIVNTPGSGVTTSQSAAGSVRQISKGGATSFPKLGSVPAATAKPAALHGFDGIAALQSRLVNGYDVEPPDEGLGVGNGYVVNAVNDAIAVYNTAGAPVTGVSDLNSFFGYSPAPFVTDPSVYYDQATQRWFVDVLTLEADPATGNPSGPNHIDIAVSKSADPTGGWNIYRLAVQNDGTDGTPNHGTANYAGPFLGDFPHIGADRNGIFITTNEYEFFGDGYHGSQIYAFSKSALEAGASNVSVVQFDTGANPDANPDGQPAFTVIPASTPDSAYAGGQGGTEYLLSSSANVFDTGTDNRLVIWSLTNTKSLDSAHPSLSLTGSTIIVDPFSLPPPADQKAGVFPLGQSVGDPAFVAANFPGADPIQEVEGVLDSVDSRMTQVDTGVSVGGATKAGIAWYVINPQVSSHGTSGTIANQGTLALAGNNLIVPALGVTPSGKGVIGFTVSGKDYFPSAGYATLDAKTGTGAIQITAAGIGPEDGFAPYTFFGYVRPRWGDYSAAAVDGENVWLASEYIANSGTVAQFQADPTLGGTRSPYANWNNRITPVSTLVSAGKSSSVLGTSNAITVNGVGSVVKGKKEASVSDDLFA